MKSLTYRHVIVVFFLKLRSVANLFKPLILGSSEVSARDSKACQNGCESEVRASFV